MMRFRRRFGVPAAIVAAVAAAVGGVLAGGAGATGSAEGTAVVRFAQDWTNFDVQTGGTSGDFMYLLPAYDRLVGRGPGLKLVPYLATRWTLTPPSRPKVVTFTIRKDAKCADGAPVTPLVVLNSFKRMILVPKTRNVIPNYFGPGPFQLSANVKQGTFTFKSLTPFKNLLAGFALGLGSVICPNGLAAVQSDPKALQTGMYGSGPYTLISATHGDQVVFKLRHDWTWGPPGTSWRKLPENLVYKIITDDTTAANSLLTGAVDIGAVNGPDVARLKSDPSIVTQTAYNYHVYPLIFNQFPGHITTDEKVRQALMMTVNQKDWNQAAFNGDGVPSPSILHPKGECYTAAVDKHAPKLDLAAARQVLQSDGYSMQNGVMTKNGDPLKLVLVTSTAMGLGGEYLQNQFNQIGAQVELRNVNNALYAAAVVGNNFDVAVASFTVTTPEAGQNLSFFVGPPRPVGSNAGWTGRGDNELLRLALHANSYTGAKACSYFVQLAERYLDNHYMLGLSAPITYMFNRKTWSTLPIVEPAYIQKT
jgi:peptide/nickel transport system substrate-binding protein